MIEGNWTLPAFVTVVYANGSEEIMRFEEANRRFRVVTTPPQNQSEPIDTRAPSPR